MSDHIQDQILEASRLLRVTRSPHHARPSTVNQRQSGNSAQAGVARYDAGLHVTDLGPVMMTTGCGDYDLRIHVEAARRRCGKQMTTSATFVSVPVLSNANWVAPARFSTATPPRNKIPRRAPAAMATRIADGTDKTSAHGDATTSTVIEHDAVIARHRPWKGTIPPRR